MSTYAIGDVQGCFQALTQLLAKINFNAQKDELWFVGDLVNRGPESLTTLRFIKNLGTRARVVLGNHDLHLLAVYFNLRPMYTDDTLQEILDAPDADILLAWLRQQPLAYYDSKLKYLMVHAGVAPMWDLNTTLNLAQEVQDTLSGPEGIEFLKHMYGNEPDIWSNTLTGWERLRVITNYLTRLRYCDVQGHLDLKTKDLHPAPNFYPWFAIPGRKTAQDDIIFGHWASLAGKAENPHVFALDTGAVWGGKLTALCLENRIKFSVSA
jgi:bis(5'-nucleosyl)-tetraphosphatase (symmetrical)